MWATSVIFVKMPKVPKQSPIGRKFAQSGHPGCMFSKVTRGFFKPTGKIAQVGALT
jgi:hypothetical protein